MPKHRCLVWMCKSSEDNIIYHKLTKNRYAEWMKALGRNPDENLSFDNIICSKHFTNEDYFLKNGKRKLKANAVPTANLPLFKRENVETTSTSISDLRISSPTKRPLIDDNIIVQPDKEIVCSPTKQQRKDFEKTIDEENASLNKSPDNEHLQSHNYCLSMRGLEIKLATEKYVKNQIYTQLRNGRQREARLRRNIIHLKSLVFVLKRKNFISEDVKRVLDKAINKISLPLMKPMKNKTKTKTGKITRKKVS